MRRRTLQLRKRLIGAGAVLGLVAALVYIEGNESTYLKKQQRVSAASISKEQLLMEGKTSAKYTYYYDGNSLRRTKDGKVSSRLAGKIQGEFYLDAQNVYYVGAASRAIYRRKKDGSSPVCLKKYVKQIVEVKDGYIYYINTSGETWRITVDGKKRNKLLGASAIYNTLYTNEYIYYTNYTSGKDGFTNGYQLKRIRRDGSGSTILLRLPLAQKINHRFSMAASKRYVYFTAGDAIYRIDGKGNANLLYQAEACQRMQIIRATDKTVYIANEREEEFEPVIQKVSMSGKVQTLLNLGEQGIHQIEKINIAISGDWQIITCYGSESLNRIFILDSKYQILQEIPKSAENLAGSKCVRVRINGKQIYVKYEKGKSIRYVVYKIKGSLGSKVGDRI